ncbi:hypothetical protein R1sor_015184 [Riccia sorocarpa]|uniref:Uncharacterized protein n=1 Tax=Riccia sorocarpa TaxID=122646 RepID=A0ABD3HBK1_9MARC
MMNVVANAISGSVAPSISLHQQRCCIYTSCSGACPSWSVVRSPNPNLSDAAMTRKLRYQCAAAPTRTQRASTVETDSTLFPSSVDAEKCAEQGIRCYSNEKGEITCEGFDEGPHFHPVARTQQRTVMNDARCKSLLTRGNSASPGRDAVDLAPANVVEVEERGECYCEGKDES